jgi:hypothetical protein
METRETKIPELGTQLDEETLQRFKLAHPQLSKTTAEIEAILGYDMWESDINGSRIVHYDPPIKKISITHGIFFDNRLIPKKFEDWQVENIKMDDEPILPIIEDNVSPREFLHPKFYIRYVKSNLGEIRQKLNQPDLSQLDALDALVHTGDFSAYIEWWSEQNVESRDALIRRKGEFY